MYHFRSELKICTHEKNLYFQIALLFLLIFSHTESKNSKFVDDICGQINGQRIYLEHGEAGSLEAYHRNNVRARFATLKQITQNRCSVEFISCPWCIIRIDFKFLNLSRNCERSAVFESCACNFVWIYEPSFEQATEQFCGHFISSNLTTLAYKSQTRKVVVEFIYNWGYDHAFNLNYVSERNKIISTGFPQFGHINNSNQTISTPFFPNWYPSDLTMEHVINCGGTNETCRISLIFTDFLLAPATIIDVFDWNNERIYVTSGSIFRPPIIISSGPSLVLKFYANGASNLGFKAYYSFILGHLENYLTPDADCGGLVNNLGGGITMMNMVAEGVKSFDCIWLIQAPEISLHLKTHLYVKVMNFSGFASTTELTIRQGLTSEGPQMETRKYNPSRYYSFFQKEHIVPISQGFYVRVKGSFRSESRLALVYAAFNYKECLAGSDFLCDNKRCISSLLKCDGFNHCGDNSDENPVLCSQDPQDRRQWSNTPHFFFPKNSDITAPTIILLLCSLGLICLIFSTVILLYRINNKMRHQSQIPDHTDIINAILEESVGAVEEDIIIPDDPPDYEAPPNYEEATKIRKKRVGSQIVPQFQNDTSIARNSRSCQTTSAEIPDSPPPAYENIKRLLGSKARGTAATIFDISLPSFSLIDNCVCQQYVVCNGLCKKCFSDSELSCLSNVSINLMRSKNFTTDDLKNFI